MYCVWHTCLTLHILGMNYSIDRTSERNLFQFIWVFLFLIVAFSATGQLVSPYPVNDFLIVDEDVSLATSFVVANDMDADGTIIPRSLSILRESDFGIAVSDTANGMIHYAPYPNLNGIDSIQYEICDNDELCATAWLIITVNPVNDIPFINSDTGSLEEDDFVAIQVTANDFDSFDIGSGINNASVILIFPGPIHGNAAINAATGEIIYTPFENWYGTEIFQYEVCDLGLPLPGACAQADVVIEINPVNDQPIANNDTVTIDEDQFVVIDVLANDTDSLDPDGGIDPTSLSVITDPEHGTFITDAISGEIIFTPSFNYFGSDSLQYEVCDSGFPGSGLCDQAWLFFDINPIEDAAVITAFPVLPVDYCFGEVVIANGFNVEEYDGDSILAIVKIKSGYISGQDYLVQNSPLSSDWDPVGGRIIFSAASPLEIGFALQTVAYQNVDAPGYELGENRTITYSLIDKNSLISSPEYELELIMRSGEVSICDADGDNISDGTECTSGPNCDMDLDGVVNYLDPDSDNDGIPDMLECGGLECVNSDEDNIPDWLDPDSDNNGIADWLEQGNKKALLGDIDFDGIDDAYDEDNGAAGLNTILLDTDLDGNADFVDVDNDDDGISDFLEVDRSPPSGLDSNEDGVDDGVLLSDFLPDSDGDAIADFIDPDSDNDGIADFEETGTTDTDGDFLPDFRDSDSDADGLKDHWEANRSLSSGVDIDADGIDDAYDVDFGGPGLSMDPPDTDQDGYEDYRDLDSDGDGILDGLGENQEAFGDCNGNLIPDFIDSYSCQLDVVNVFTPNGDGINEVFYVWGIEGFPDSEITFYNRWENIVWQTNGYQNDWSGTSTNSGNPLPDGTYYYILKLDNSESKIFNGFVTIKR
ncbi:MAG: gliding motility-associated-like protein [Limisphaerales bacterium]|jgi:gliding motility-associated-like protein